MCSPGWYSVITSMGPLNVSPSDTTPSPAASLVTTRLPVSDSEMNASRPRPPVRVAPGPMPLSPPKLISVSSPLPPKATLLNPLSWIVSSPLPPSTKMLTVGVKSKSVVTMVSSPLPPKTAELLAQSGWFRDLKSSLPFPS